MQHVQPDTQVDSAHRVRAHGQADRVPSIAAKGFSSWSQFVAMLFCQLGRAHSLREIEGGLESCEGKLAHLGIDGAGAVLAVLRQCASALGAVRAGVLRLFETVAAKAVGARSKFRFKNKLVSLDSTVIDLCLSMFDWAKFRRTKGAVKLHLVLDHDGYLPCFGRDHRGQVARRQGRLADRLRARHDRGR